MKQTSYVQQTIAQLCDADFRRSDAFAQWRGDAVTPADLANYLAIAEVSDKLETGFNRLNETYASFSDPEDTGGR